LQGGRGYLEEQHGCHGGRDCGGSGGFDGLGWDVSVMGMVLVLLGNVYHAVFFADWFSGRLNYFLDGFTEYRYCLPLFFLIFSWGIGDWALGVNERKN